MKKTAVMSDPVPDMPSAVYVLLYKEPYDSWDDTPAVPRIELVQSSDLGRVQQIYNDNELPNRLIEFVPSGKVFEVQTHLKEVTQGGKVSK